MARVARRFASAGGWWISTVPAIHDWRMVPTGGCCFCLFQGNSAWMHAAMQMDEWGIWSIIFGGDVM